MSTTAIASRATSSLARAVAVIAIAVAVVVLLTIAFVIGRATASSSHQAPPSPPVTTPQTNPDLCRMDRAC
jgi:hypothetical protein